MKHLKIGARILVVIALLSSCNKDSDQTMDPSFEKYNIQASKSQGKVADQYIVQFKSDKLSLLPAIGGKNSVERAFEQLQRLAGSEIVLLYTYTNTIHGVAVEATEEALSIIRESDLVASVESNFFISLIDGQELPEKHGKNPQKGYGSQGKGNGKGPDKPGNGGDGSDGGDGGDGGTDSGPGNGNGKGGGKGKDKEEPSPDPSDSTTTDTPDANQPSQFIPTGITRVGGAKTVSGKVAWIIDSGIDGDHPDLLVDKTRSAFFLSQSGENSWEDNNGHGTHIAGTIGAIDNSIGVVGVAAGASVVAIKVLDGNGNGTVADVIAGIDYVVGTGNSGDVVNLSLAGPSSQILDDAVINAGAKGFYMVIAAGNYADDVQKYSPARAQGTNVYTISAINGNDIYAAFSNYGNSVVYAAPGVNVTSTWLNGEYSSISGTSMAAPHVAGLLISGGILSKSAAINDPDTRPDPIAER
ncbi:MAG: S8 family serine peptidase [Luteibaculum sp.]